eukprot:CAMPEP_0194298416 /NCGR_PEP_ID=MMETSP0169-20130528/60151_1 /TAXON_ID=218684 /ORGANISM="Corethron pennatum, Strain L29A3" /LENGTH=484 /DNA_ID=CAMNT_0039048393 /DNA_START=44 /DNA_END=1494 /DNA_ORIENTATION=-
MKLNFSFFFVHVAIAAPSFDTNITFSDRSLETTSGWSMTYSSSSGIQDPTLWNYGSEYIKQNGAIWDDPKFYIRRLCSVCAESHRDIIYKRLTTVPSDMDVQDLFLANWVEKDNKLGVDFKLYSSFEDAENDSNEWTFCNYDSPGIGFPRDCGPVSGQWNSLNKGGKTPVSFYVWDQNPTILGGWSMTYSSGSGANNQDPALWNNGSEYIKQNGHIWDDPTFYIRRLCSVCAETHRDIIYKRLTTLPSDMDVQDLFLANWVEKDNKLGVDFKLYSSFEDAENDSNEWTFCNYDSPGIGFPRDCGPVSGQWNSLNKGGKTPVSFYVWDQNPSTRSSKPSSDLSTLPTSKPSTNPSSKISSGPSSKPSSYLLTLPTSKPSSSPSSVPISLFAGQNFVIGKPQSRFNDNLGNFSVLLNYMEVGHSVDFLSVTFREAGCDKPVNDPVITMNKKFFEKTDFYTPSVLIDTTEFAVSSLIVNKSQGESIG